MRKQGFVIDGKYIEIEQDIPEEPGNIMVFEGDQYFVQSVFRSTASPVDMLTLIRLGRP